MKPVYPMPPFTAHIAVEPLQKQACATIGSETLESSSKPAEKSKTKNALRVQKSREKTSELGLKQINVIARTEVHATIRAIAKETKNDVSLLAQVLERIAESHQTKTTEVRKSVHFTHHSRFEREAYELGLRIKSLTGWRQKVLRYMGLI